MISTEEIKILIYFFIQCSVVAETKTGSWKVHTGTFLSRIYKVAVLTVSLSLSLSLSLSDLTYMRCTGDEYLDGYVDCAVWREKMW
jgi:hypothetical protein